MPKITYMKARSMILDALETQGWAVKRKTVSGKPLRVPHATTPDGQVRLYFRPRAVHAASAELTQNAARSIDQLGTGPDLRELAVRAPTEISDHLATAGRRTARAL